MCALLGLGIRGFGIVDCLCNQVPFKCCDKIWEGSIIADESVLVCDEIATCLRDVLNAILDCWPGWLRPKTTENVIKCPGYILWGVGQGNGSVMQAKVPDICLEGYATAGQSRPKSHNWSTALWMSRRGRHSGWSCRWSVRPLQSFLCRWVSKPGLGVKDIANIRFISLAKK